MKAVKGLKSHMRNLLLTETGSVDKYISHMMKKFYRTTNWQKMEKVESSTPPTPGPTRGGGVTGRTSPLLGGGRGMHAWRAVVPACTAAGFGDDPRAD